MIWNEIRDGVEIHLLILGEIKKVLFKNLCISYNWEMQFSKIWQTIYLAHFDKTLIFFIKKYFIRFQFVPELCTSAVVSHAKALSFTFSAMLKLYGTVRSFVIC